MNMMTREELELEIQRDLGVDDLYSLPGWLTELITRLLDAGWVKEE